MRFPIVAAFVLLPAVAAAGPSEDAYFNSRDAYVATFDVNDDVTDAVLQKEEEAEADLGTQLQKIVGPINVTGVPAEGEISLDTLFKGDEGFGLLDGLYATSDDGDLQVVVTTEPLLDHWLGEHLDWLAPDGPKLPKDVEKALRSDNFYTQAISTDAAVLDHGAIPVTKPVGADFAYAMLDQRTNGADPGTPDEIIVSALEGGRLYIISAPTTVPVEPAPECTEAWRGAQAKADEAYDAYSSTDPRDAKLLDVFTKISKDGDAAFRQCFQDRLKDQKSFPALVAEAQGMLDRLPQAH